MGHFKGLKIIHITLIDLKKDLPMPILGLPFLTLPLRCFQTMGLSTCILICNTDSILNYVVVYLNKVNVQRNNV